MKDESPKLVPFDSQHWTDPQWRQRMLASDWQKILLTWADQITFRGRVVPMIMKNIGHGVVEVFKDPKNLIKDQRTDSSAKP